ncbi:uncharacterized protein C20orf204 homolog isoform X1 [Phacochoerus africanus]|uniref:uncharacterized protein C20orf204 homolog isoform X1 n=1 Tax=Phacochoerus africanus TaxID=41426 RepID=UPI001FDA7DC6|nr:uncharacterized protein C20orf204 homolog isoform X1 [Phacochoerus africanus]
MPGAFAEPPATTSLFKQLRGPAHPPTPPWASLRGCRGRGALHGLTRYPLQGPPKPALWALLLALLGAGPGRAGLRACSVPDVLHHYRAVIFEDLQAAVRWMGPGAEGAGSGSRHHFIQKNLTGAAASGRQGRVGASCGAQKEHNILLSIVALGQTLRGAVAGGRRGALEKAAWTVAVRTEAVMRRHCWTLRQPSRRSETRLVRRRGGRRRLLLRALDAVATCWEKLFALRAGATRDS